MNGLRKEAEAVGYATAYRTFASDAYDYNDDVTAEGIAKMQALSDVFLADEEWEQVDGFGIVIPA